MSTHLPAPAVPSIIDMTPSPMKTVIIASISVGLFLIAGTSIISVWLVRRRRLQRKASLGMTPFTSPYTTINLEASPHVFPTNSDHSQEVTGRRPSSVVSEATSETALLGDSGEPQEPEDDIESEVPAYASQYSWPRSRESTLPPPYSPLHPEFAPIGVPLPPGTHRKK